MPGSKRIVFCMDLNLELGGKLPLNIDVKTLAAETRLQNFLTQNHKKQGSTNSSRCGGMGRQ